MAQLGNAKAGIGQVRLSPGGELIIPPLSAEDIPAEAAELKEELSGLLPLVPIASLLVELDRRTGFLDCFSRTRCDTSIGTGTPCTGGNGTCSTGGITRHGDDSTGAQVGVPIRRQ